MDEERIALLRDYNFGKPRYSLYPFLHTFSFPKWICFSLVKCAFAQVIVIIILTSTSVPSRPANRNFKILSPATCEVLLKLS